MRPPRFSLAALAGAVLLCGVGLAALRWPSVLAANAVFTGALAALVIAIVGVVNCRGPRRAYWSGFALGGWIYLLASLGPWLDQYSPHLFTTTLLHISEARLIAPDTPPAPAASGAMGSAAMMGMAAMPGMMPGSSAPTRPVDLSLWDLWTEVDRNRRVSSLAGVPLYSPESYLRIGHSMFCLLIAFACGKLGRHFWVSNAREAGADRLASEPPMSKPAPGGTA